MKDFSSVYAEMCLKRDVLEKLQKKLRITVLIYCIVAIIILFVLYYFYFKHIFFSIIIAVFLFSGIAGITKFHARKFRYQYKNVVVDSIVKCYDDNLSFSPDCRISLAEYHRGFYDRGERIESEDCIRGIHNDNSIMMAEVKVTHVEEHTDSEGRTTRSTVVDFHGMFGWVDLTRVFLKNKILITGDLSKGFFNRKRDNNRVELESAEFEKRFDVLSDDRMYIMKVFKPELINEFIELKEKGIKTFNMNAEANRIYFRFTSKNYFEPSIAKDVLDKDMIMQTANLIEIPVNLIDSIIEAIAAEQNVDLSKPPMEESEAEFFSTDSEEKKETTDNENNFSVEKEDSFTTTDEEDNNDDYFTTE